MISAQQKISATSLSAPAIWQIGIIIPTFNASRHWHALHRGLMAQGIKGSQVVIVDSSSTDNTPELVLQAGYRLMTIPTQHFRHGATRQMAAETMSSYQFLLYLTQDAHLCGDRPVEKLLRAFSDPEVGAAYGRQIPRADAGPIERHARLFNYPGVTEIRSFEDREHLGFRTAFFSNSFAAYRRTAFEEVGGFPKKAIVSEEVTVAARMLLSGWKIAYQGEAKVIHSHPLTFAQEFSRYFDIGVHHSQERWLLDEFGRPGGNGRRFVASQMHYLWRVCPSQIPLAMARNMSKWCAYKLGLHERYLHIGLKRAISAQSNFWCNERTATASYVRSRDPREIRS
jgi:rhamnosyltransferase